MGRTGKDGGGGGRGDLVTIPEIPYMGAESAACIIASGLVRSPTFPFLSCFSDLVLRLLRPLWSDFYRELFRRNTGGVA